MIRNCFYVIGLCAVVACSADSPARQRPAAPSLAQSPEAATRPAPTFAATVQPNADSTYGYVIMANGRPLILQPHVPGRPGTRGFATAAQARQVAQLVAGKLRRGQMPPSITAAELDSLGL